MKKDLKQQLIELENIENALAKKDLHGFFCKAWYILNPNTHLLKNWHQELICEYLQACEIGQIKRLVINLPPRYSKSSLVSIMYPCWVWANNPSEKFLFTTYAHKFAVKHSMDRRTIIGSKWYQKNIRSIYLSVDNLDNITNSERGHFLSTSLRGTGTGLGANRIIVDDPHDAERSESDLIRDTDIEIFNKKFTTRLDDKKRGVIIVVMQRLHENDLSGYLLSSGGYEHLKIQGIETETKTYVMPISKKEIVRNEGDILHEDRENADMLEANRKAMTCYGFEGQYQQEPSPREGGIFKKNYWKFYNRLPEKFDEIIDVWDCTFKDLESSDYVAGGVWGIVGTQKYLLDVIYRKMGFIETINAMKSNRAKYPTIARTIIEDKANGTAIIEVLKTKLNGIIPFNPGSNSKQERAISITPQLEAGEFLLPCLELATFDVEEYIDNLAKFPKAAHDDLVDMTSMMGIYTKNSSMQFYIL